MSSSITVLHLSFSSCHCWSQRQSWLFSAGSNWQSSHPVCRLFSLAKSPPLILLGLTLFHFGNPKLPKWLSHLWCCSSSPWASSPFSSLSFAWSSPRLFSMMVSASLIASDVFSPLLCLSAAFAVAYLQARDLTLALQFFLRTPRLVFSLMLLEKYSSFSLQAFHHLQFSSLLESSSY